MDHVTWAYSSLRDAWHVLNTDEDCAETAPWKQWRHTAADDDTVRDRETLLQVAELDAAVAGKSDHLAISVHQSERRIPYYTNEHTVDIDELTAGINKATEAFLLRYPAARIAIEPGRYLVGPSGIYLVQVRYVKRSRGERFVITDGGTHQNMSAVGMGTYLKRNFPMALLSDADRPASGPCTVTGLLLTPTDIIAKDINLPDVSPGEVLGVFQSGAYGPSASITYMNGQGYPAEVLVYDGTAHLVRSRDTVEDLFTRQIVADLGDEDLAASIRAEIVTLLDGDVRVVSDDTTLFDDLALDSVSMIDLLTKLEDRFGVFVDPHELTPDVFRTVGSITQFVMRDRLGNSGGHHAR